MTAKKKKMALTANELENHYVEVKSFQVLRARLVAFISKGLVIGLTLSMLANLGLAWAVASMLPLQKLVPVYLLIRPDGTIDNSVSLSTLPKTDNQAVIRSAIWQYVLMRQGYSYDTALYRYDIVSAMSSDDTRSIYQHWFNYPNPESPQTTIGQHGAIVVQPISVAFIAQNVAQVRYVQQTSMNGGPAINTTWTATVQYEQVDSLPVADRLNNPGGIVVTNYQNEEDTAQ